MSKLWFEMSEREIVELNDLELRRPQRLERERFYTRYSLTDTIPDAEMLCHMNDERDEARYQQLLTKRRAWFQFERDRAEDEREDRRSDFDPISWPGEH